MKKLLFAIVMLMSVGSLYCAPAGQPKVIHSSGGPVRMSSSTRTTGWSLPWGKGSRSRKKETVKTPEGETRTKIFYKDGKPVGGVTSVKLKK
jgi:hypothetical protein